LATFNDPDVPQPFVTTDPNAFIAAISSLSANGGGDCPELAGAGMLEAVSAATSGGSLFVFTDADAKDPTALREATELAAEKKIEVFFPVFGSCAFDAPDEGGGRSSVQGAARTNYPTSRSHSAPGSGRPIIAHGIDPIYQEAAEATGGQAFSLDESEAGQITTLLDHVSRTKAVNLLFIQDTLGPSGSTYSVPIDDTMSTAIFSVSGGTSVTLIRPDGSTVQPGDPGVTITSLSGADLFSIANPATGMWQISVSGSGVFSITVKGEGTFDIESFDFVRDGGDEAHEPGLFQIDGFPVAGQANMVSAELTGGFSSAQFEFRSPSGAILQILPLQQGTDNASDLFVGSVSPPNTPFVVYATGHTSSGASFQRLVPGTIMPQSVTITAPSPIDLIPGGSTSYTFQVQNLALADTFHIEAADDKGFVTNVTPTDLSLNAGETKEVTVGLQAPADAIPGTSDTLTMTATGGLGARNFAVVVTNVIMPTVATPLIRPNGGTFRKSETVKISDSTPGATIHFTRDGTDPTAASAVYNAQKKKTGIKLSGKGQKIIKAIAMAPGYNDSAIATAVFTLK
jgi:hypothetical protein